MGDWFLAAGTALWLGILTSISPCPLATNIVAISFVGRRVGSPAGAFFSGLLYTLGRSLTYLVLGVLLVGSLLSVPQVSLVLQRVMAKALGPLLILVGMVLLDLLRVNLPARGLGARMQARVERWGAWGALVLGILFALSFCPLSAALFFGSLIPLAIQNGSRVLLPSLYGVGTALPVFAFALLIALGARSLAAVFDRLTQVERWARRVTGVVFIGVGIYFSLAYIFEVFA
jgi:cytochrome c biogenesis protein CcdA